MTGPTNPDLAALARWALVPRVLHDVVEPDPGVELLERPFPHPIVRRYHGAARAAPDGRPDARRRRRRDRAAPRPGPGAGLGQDGRADARGPAARRPRRPALALDLTHLGDVAPFGTQPWRPRTREDLAELAAAAGRPVWLVGVASADDATVAAEAGLDAIVVDAAVGRRLGGPATADVLPEVVDAVAGMLRVLAGGHVRDGLDVFRLLALGADAVVVAGDRPTSALDDELRYALRLTGCATLADVGYAALFEPLFGEP